MLDPQPLGVMPTSPSFEALAPRPPPRARPLEPPGKMAKPDILPVNSFSVTVVWTAPADLHSRRARVMLNAAAGRSPTPDSQLPVIGYRLRYLARTPGEEEAVDWVVCEETWPPTVERAVLKWLEGGKDYVFQVLAWNSAGDGIWSEPSEPFLMPVDSCWFGPRAPPTFLATSPDSIEIQWQMPCHRGAEIQVYDILCSEDPNFAEQHTRQLQIPGDATVLMVNNLKPNTVYYFKYRAVNAKGASKWSSATPGASTAAMPPERPDPPMRLGDPSTFRPFDMCIKWHHPECYNIPVQHYRVRQSLSEDMTDAIEVTVGGGPRGAVPINEEGKVPEDLTATTSPSARRPGFSKNGYALTQMKIKGLHPGTAYYFQVKATNQIGESDWSLPSVGLRTTASPPARCQKPRYISGNKHDGMHIYWPVPESYGVLITRYDVRVAQHAMMIGETVITTERVPTTPYQGTSGAMGQSLVEAIMGGCWDPGISHFYQVRAVTSAGMGEWSESSEEMRTDPEKPVRPDQPHRFGILPRAIVVYWKAPDGRGAPIIGYRLRYAVNQGMADAKEVRGRVGTDCEFAVPGLEPHQSYFFQVQAMNKVGSSDWSLPSRPVAVMQEPPNKMSAPVLVKKTSTSMILSFAVPSDCGTNDGKLIQSYTLVWAQGKDCLERLAKAIQKEDDTVSVNRHAVPNGTEVTNLQPGIRCAFQVYAVNEFGESEASDVAQFCTNPAAPEKPGQPEIVESTRWSIIIKFALGIDNGSPITDYSLRVEDVEAGKTWDLGPWELALDTDGQQYHGAHHLRPGREYHVHARTINAEGASEWSEKSALLLTEAAPPDPVTEVNVEDTSSTSFEISWKVPYNHGEPVTEYCVQWSADETFRVAKELKVPSSETTAVCDGLTPGMIGFARVAASNKCGYGEFGPHVNAEMKVDVPHYLQRPRAIEVGPIHVKISWMLPYDCGDKITHFWIRYSETETDGRPERERDRGEFLVEGRKHSCILAPMLSAREYTFDIAAENSVGIGDWSLPSLPVRIASAVVPLMPGKPSFVTNSITSVVARWNQPEAMGSAIIEQVVRISTSPLFEEGTYRDVVVPAWSPDLPGVETKEPGCPASRPMTVSTAAGSRPTTVGTSTTSWLGQSSNTADYQGDSSPPTLDVSSALHTDGAAQAAEEEDPLLSLERRRKLARRAQGNINSILGLILRIARKKEANYAIEECLPGTGYYLKVAARNGIGQSEWSEVSELMDTQIAPPDPIPQDPGIIVLRPGCTTLTFGWQQPSNCWGAPVTHYIVRFAESEEALWKGDCLEFEHEEPDRPEWPGMMHPAPLPPLVKGEDLEDEEAITKFAEYVLVRFGTLEECWEWLDVSGNGDVSEIEFLEGDVDNGPPFADFKHHEVLSKVWNLLDADGGGNISMNEFNKLRPYMDKLHTGTSGISYKGVCCLVPGLIPGKSYHIMAKCVNKAGMSEWTQCLTDPHKTEGMVPAKTVALQAVPEMRTLDSVTFRWELPYDNGAPLNDVEVRYCARNVEQPLPDSRALRDGKLVELDPDPETGKLPTELTIGGLSPGQVVMAVARAFNDKGGSREWSDLPGPGRGDPKNLITWDCATLPTTPSEPGVPAVNASSLRSANNKASGEFLVPLPLATNGLPVLAFEFMLLDPSGEVITEWETEVTQKDREASVSNGSLLRRPLCDMLVPGGEYAVRARAMNVAGFSSWSRTSEVFRTPPDRPMTPNAILSEFTSVRWIELKWFPPHDNGAEIDTWDIAYKLLRSDVEWAHVDGRHLTENIKEHGYDGRRTAKANRGSKLYRLEGLKENDDYVFKWRAKNAVGWSEWAEESYFRTKAVAPSKVQAKAITLTHLDTREIAFMWIAPECNGMEIKRYDIASSPSVRMIRWAHLVQLCLSLTVDADKLFGFKTPGNLTGGEIIGRDRFDQLLCDECAYSPVDVPNKEFHLKGLLPGQEYYFIMRAVNDKGKGEFSEIWGPVKTNPEKPSCISPVQVIDVDDRSCRFYFRLPYNMGSCITEAKAVLLRTDGPLSSRELDPETQEPHAHIARREWSLDVDALVVNPWAAQSPRPVSVGGTTGAHCRSFRDSGVEGHMGTQLGFVPTLENPTDADREGSVDGLRPGTWYEVRWSCRNYKGWSPWSEPTKFLTEAMHPDTPEPMLIPSL